MTDQVQEDKKRTSSKKRGAIGAINAGFFGSLDNGTPAEQEASTPASQLNSTPASQQASLTVHQQASKPVVKKYTYYLPVEKNLKLEQIRLARLARGIVVDKSALVSEAIELLKDEQKVEQVIVSPPVTPAPVVKKQSAEVEVPMPLPDDLVTLQAFADLHFVSRNEAERLRKTGAITAVKGNWTVGKQRVTIALDVKGRRDFWVQFHETPGFRACDYCPHSQG
jgi:hypothetical protein